MKNRSGGPRRGTWVALGVAYLARRRRKAKKARVRGQAGQPLSAGAFSPPPGYAYAAPSVVHQPASASLLRWLAGIAVGVGEDGHGVQQGGPQSCWSGWARGDGRLRR